MRMLIKNFKFKEGDILTSESFPDKSLKIKSIDLCTLYGKEDTHLDDEMTMIIWERGLTNVPNCGGMTLKSFKTYVSAFRLKKGD